jgi:hypothetical protein
MSRDRKLLYSSCIRRAEGDKKRKEKHRNKYMVRKNNIISGPKMHNTSTSNLSIRPRGHLTVG